ncbi:tumor necrosis factor receptor superfamily member 10B-like isoform X2 [Ovis canadensis]|uniref:tumor necrosis factor receptor superfamily member 10B-like isoform X2 n=1 Tax=Ovis canadensis TaxID=37174 RepID=UPI0037531DC9
MTVPTINLRGPRQRTLPDRGRRAPASSSAGAGRPGGPKLRFEYLIVVMGVVLWVKPASAMSVRKDEIHQQSSAPLEGSLQQKLCLPGFYMEEASGGCAPCTDGTDYTSHSNTLSSCLPCMTCKSGEEEKNRCTPTKDTECQCKPGTFRGEDAPEFCQKCTTGCPDGKVMVKDCTPWSDIKCVDQESGALTHGEAPVPGEPATVSQRLRIGIITGVVIIIVLIAWVVWCFLKGLFDECWRKVIGFSSIWQHQTLSNCFCPTTKPSVDVVPGLSQQPTRLRHPWDSPGRNTGVGCHFPLQCTKVKSESEVAQSCPTLHDSMDCSLPGSSVHGSFQLRPEAILQ